MNKQQTQKCSECENTGAIEWMCLDCKVHFHDFCIVKHRGSITSVSHCVIPAFDALTQSSASDKKQVNPNVDKVIVSGPGIQPAGICGEYEGKFTVDTCDAGFGKLSVQITGPKGGFQAKMKQNEKIKTQVACSYDALFPGEYIINITMSGLQVPGSPFKVKLRDTHDKTDD